MAQKLIEKELKSKTDIVQSAAFVSGVFTFFCLLFYIVAKFYENSFLNIAKEVFSIGFTISILYLFVVFLVWLYFLVYVLGIFEKNIGVKNYMVIVWFFVPIFNFFKPYLIVRDIWVLLCEINNENKVKYGFIKFWWAWFLISMVFSKFAINSEFFVYNLLSYKVVNVVYIAAMFINLFYVFIFYKLVKSFARKFKSALVILEK